MADRRRNLGIPSGVVFPFAGTSAPYGYLICDGRAVPREEYGQLFLAIGTSHGSGNGVDTFNLPDYRGNFLRGKVDVTTVAGSGTVPLAPNNTQATFTGHGINRTGFKVRLSTGTLGGLATNIDYYAIVIDNNTLAFATTLANALAGTRITLTSGSANSAVIVQFEDPDYSSRSAATVGGSSAGSVGSMQDDAVQNHNHHYIYRERDQTRPSGSTVNLADSTGFQSDSDLDRIRYFTETQGPNGNFSPESRPKNMLVNYIIKV